MSRPWSIDELRQRASRLPRIPLAHLPTPLEEWPRLSEALGKDVRILAKRDDLTSVGCGGNKIRKLEFSLAAAKAAGCDTIVHGLAGQSNYCRQTAAAAAKCGMKCVLVLALDHKTDGTPQGNLMLDHVFGAEVRMVAPAEQGAAKDALMEELAAQGRKAYRVGHDDEVFGAVGYALCMAEIVEQAAALGVDVDTVCVSGRLGTTAGLILAKRLLGFEGAVQSFHVAPASGDEALRGPTVKVLNDAAALLGCDERFTIDDVHNTDRYAGPRYGEPTAECLEAMLLLARTEGQIASPVYTAKGLAGMVDFVRTGRIAPGSTTVFVHTGGMPETFAYNEEVSRAAMGG
ncbi:MAG: D-cysteine desulfhydrase family protein [Planctomycetes bacterium]|nr:D-cysteine desulfhydrase family protein [Planctomycetota bacterium]